MKTKHVQYTSTQHSTQVNKYNLKVDNQNNKTKFDKCQTFFLKASLYSDKIKMSGTV